MFNDSDNSEAARAFRNAASPAAKGEADWTGAVRYYGAGAAAPAWEQLVAGILNRGGAQVQQQPGGMKKVCGLPTDSEERKRIPIGTFLLEYFPDAIIEMTKLSYDGNEKHNPGEPMHWAREKSSDQVDCIFRHLFDFGAARDCDDLEAQINEMRSVMWRAGAQLQLLCEQREEESYSE